MCTGMGSTTATIGNQVTNSKTATPIEKKKAAKTLASAYGLIDKDPPPIAADLEQKATRDAMLKAQRALLKQGRASTFPSAMDPSKILGK